MMFKVVIVECFLVCLVGSQIVGPPGKKQTYSKATDYETCDSCHWISPYGVLYDLSVPCQHHFTVWMENPKAAQITFGVCSKVECEGYDKAMACVLVPGNKPTSSGQHLIFEPLELHQPSSGVQLILIDGEICSVTRKPRKTVINFHCDSSYNLEDSSVPGLAPSRAYEGQGDDVCNYYVNFHSKYGCPRRANKYAKLSPQITSVIGCTDSDPLLSTRECSSAGEVTLSIHGADFSAEGQKPVSVTIKIGEQECTSAKVVDAWTIRCQLSTGTGEELPVSAIIKTATSVKQDDGSENILMEEIHISNPAVTVSYKPLIDYKRHFDSFLESGVGGLSKQITELYQRAFASRGVPARVLDQMGIEHAKGILLHGPPGSGKTLLAKTIAKILNTEQVKLVNAPEIMSKYLGESEKNLRVHFDEAERAWMEQGEKSDLHIIIIDEIDAICKPRGKADSSAAAAAYDSVVNQLLTKMDGLRSLHNVLVIGMTNRPELIDPALLRPGRFEIQIEIGLPDEEGRWEIFVIHTRQMKENGFLSGDVNLRELAANTTQFSGAEIAGLVRLAASYALDRKYSRGSSLPLLVTRRDFLTALQRFTPAYTQKEEDVLQEFLPRGFLKCGKVHDQVVENVMTLTEMLQDANTQNIESILLYGPKGSGKSGLVGHIASLLKFDLVKVITPQSLLGLSDIGKTEKLIETFHDASRSEFGLLVLDDLHNMMETVHIGGQTSASQNLIHTLSTLLSSKISSGRKLVVIGTLWSEHENLAHSYTGNVGLQDMFTTKMFVPKLKLPGALTLLSELGIMRKGREFFRMPQQINVPLRTMLKITDCVRHKVTLSNGDLLNTPQYFMDECLSLFPHMDKVASVNM